MFISARSLKTPARRSLIASLAVVTTLFIAAMPASARPGNGQGGGKGGQAATSSSDVTITLTPSAWSSDPCAFDATITWAKVNNTTAGVRLFDSAGNTLAVSPQVASTTPGWFVFTFTFGGPSGASRGIHARGSMLQNGVEISGADSPVVPTTCNGPVSVSWPTINIPLT